MRLKIRCDMCGISFTRDSSAVKGKKHLFCSRQCVWNFSSKVKNPDGYASLKDYTNISATFRRINKFTNKKRMTLEVKEKLRMAHLNSGEGKTYKKLFGRHEHRAVAEQILGRPLLDGEVVHHIDGDKRNNRPENIMVFRSQADHAKYHAEYKWFINQLKLMDEESEVMPNEVHTS